MRDDRRLREKIQLALDDRQVAALAVGALVLLSGVFTLGLLVGKQVAARVSAARPLADDLAVLDAQREAQHPSQEQHLPAPVANRTATVQPEPPRVVAPRPAEPARESVRSVPPPSPPISVAPQRALPAKPVPSTLPHPPAELGNFTVQLGASQDKTDAARLASRALAGGLRPYVAEARLPGKGLWYRVRVGAFPDRDTADRFRRDVERELRMSAAVMPSR
jgi:cell division septation protein DedD